MQDNVNKNSNTPQKGTRKGCKDVWNAYMVRGAHFSQNDIPFCPDTATSTPADIITWSFALQIYKNNIGKRRCSLHYNAFVCFYQDDIAFDGPSGIWYNARSALKVLRHFDGVITPDFSTCSDFPYPIKIYNTYRMRAFGYWLGQNGISVYNNVRWGTPETYNYCFDGIPRNETVVIGTVCGNPRKLRDRKRFEEGLSEMMKVLSPHTIIVYGSANYPCFQKLKEQGVNIIAYKSQTNRAHEK